MKITISPSSDQKLETHRINTVTIENPADDLDVDGMCDLFRAALLAMEFHPDAVKERLGE